MFTNFHSILLHFLPSNKPFSFLGLPSSIVRAPTCARATASTVFTMPRKRIILSTRSHATTLWFLIVFLHFVAFSNASDAENLIKFKGSLQNTAALSDWDISKPPCMGSLENWNGVLCDQKGKVWGLKLENMGLGGVIDVDTLAKLHDLRTISIMNNKLEGPLPNLSKIGVLKTVYLSNNKFSGEIPTGTFDGMANLKKIYLENNELSGSIPASLVALPLIELMLENNEFSGEIPNFAQSRLKLFNVSNNKLEGEIPNSLTHFSASSFDGNQLCGPPMKPCSTSTLSDTTHSSPKDKLPLPTIIIVAVLVVIVISALVIVIIILCRRRNKKELGTETSACRDLDKMEQGQSGVVSSSHAEKHGNVKLTFLKDGENNNFDLPDLLKASAEVLGSGVLGSTYKAGLNDGRVMVVKRFKNMNNNVNKEEFSEHMRRLGRLEHENVVSIVAYYYRKEEKLFVADFVDNGTLALHLHGGLPSPNWPTRLHIIKGVAKGLQYLYNELPSLTTPHGHLKSSNVLLDASFKPRLTDYALIPIANHDNMVSYKSPEYNHSRRITKKTDIWTLGILILETLTGRSPSSTDLATWVGSVGPDKTEVFDGDMEGTSHCYGEMVKLLKIGLACCDADVEKRPEIKEAVEKIDEVKEKDGDDDLYSSCASEIKQMSD